MKIGLIDVDGSNFPNLVLMKLSAYHKSVGDSVTWYDPMFTGHCDRVYMSKVFSFTDDYQYVVDADEVVKGGSGYSIYVENGRECYNKTKDTGLPYEIEHIYPDYSLYGISDTAYGFLTRGCPRGCDFCHVAVKEGRVSEKVADLSEFWNNQKNIVLMDPNITACKDWENLFVQLIDSHAWIDFNQGIDIRVMTTKKAQMLKQMRIKHIHIAWDRYEDKKYIVPRMKEFKESTGWNRQKVTVYVLCGFNTTIEQDLERIYTIKEIGFQPYVMLYNKQSIPRGHVLHKLQRYVNSKQIFWSVDTFEDYTRGKYLPKGIQTLWSD